MAMVAQANRRRPSDAPGFQITKFTGISTILVGSRHDIKR